MAYRLFRVLVEGSGEFPYDMLRYDACWPRTEQDAHQMNLAATCQGDVRRVELLTYKEYKSWQPTVGRWHSMGWKVIECEVVR